MVLHVFDEHFEYKGRVENFLNLTWDEEYQGEGKFTLTTYDTDKYAGLLKKGRYFYRTDRPVAMMAVKVERDTSDNTITVCGYTTLHLLERRIVDAEKEYSNVERGVYDIIRGDLRGLTMVTTASSKGYNDECECSFEGVGMLEAVMEMIESSELGIRSRFDHKNKRHVIEVYKGEDKTYQSRAGGTVFSQEFGNLKALKVIEDDDLFKNVAYVGGKPYVEKEESTEEDTGTDYEEPEVKTVWYRYTAPDAGSQENWREIVVDGEDQEEDQSTSAWQRKQRQIGKNALNEYRSATTFEIEISNALFGTKYELGDKVTCKSKRYDLQFDTRITEYRYSNRNGVETVKITIGEKPIEYVKGEFMRYGRKKFPFRTHRI